MGNETLAKTVNVFGGAFINVCGECGLSAKLMKHAVKTGVAAEGSCIASLIGIVGTIRGSAVILLDKKGFSSVVSTMSGGMLAGDLENPTSVSVLGELANMVCGRALVSGGLEGAEVTPPTTVVGENIRNVPATAPGMKTFTLPFEVTPEGTAFLVLALVG